ncbi:periplasmic nitrate reductase, NapE protein [uncultured Psychrobacter sp.]|uniref:periplasmic nitrate reductase, NapE protein n=1 Tax=uncultured Psychrobacter sp. TaxID=259303 RepID=UPI003459A8CE
MQHKKQLPQPPVRHEWLTAFVMSFLALPFIALLFVCAYGFIIWFAQMFYWGPPT